MDAFLARLGVQAVNYAMRCGIALTSSFALQQCSKLVKVVDDKAQQAELHLLQKTLDSKIKIISPALDLVEFRSGRGNVFLENAATLARAIQRDIVALGRQLEDAAETANAAGRSTKTERSTQIAEIISAIRRLLTRIDSDIPLLQLAITASGESLSTALPPSVSPSRLLQASMLLTVGDTQYASSPLGQSVQIGPVFTLSLYMLFLGHSSTGTSHSGSSNHALKEKEAQNSDQPYGFGKSERKPIWQEFLHKARVRLCRTPPDRRMDQTSGHRSHDRVPRSSSVASYLQQDAYAYHLEIIEDLDDCRVHEESDEEQQRQTGIQESIPICQVSKIFYADTGRILNIGSTDGGQSNAVLLLKRDLAAPVPTRAMDHMQPRPETEVSYLEAKHAADGAPMLTPPDEEQDDVDRQLQVEINRTMTSTDSSPQCENEFRRKPANRRFPAHLDPEWLALEVFAEDEDIEDSDSDDDNDNDDIEAIETPSRHKDRAVVATPDPSVDRLSDQFRNLSGPGTGSHSPDPAMTPDPAQFASQSPFGAVTTSLSMLEMLVRLTSLQEFQQTSHLAIPDHILTFFLEETSTTGLRGDARWQAKRTARQRVGFDPYTDTPTK